MWNCPPGIQTMSGKGGLTGASSDKPAALCPASIGLQIMYLKPGRVCRFGNRNPMLRSQGLLSLGDRFERHRESGEIDAGIERHASSVGKNPRSRDVQMEARRAVADGKLEIEQSKSKPPIRGGFPFTVASGSGHVQKDDSGRDEDLKTTGDFHGCVHADNSIDARTPLRHRPKRIDVHVHVLPPRGL